MPDERLTKLLKQRDLLKEHLAWLESEIARESHAERGALTIPKTPNFPGFERQVSTAADPETRSASEAVADIYTTLGPESRQSASSARQGCVWLFVIAFVVVVGAFAATYWIYGDR